VNHDQATFLAAVQAQTLSFSIQNNSTHLLNTTNAFGFTGVILDVVGAFLALLSSTVAQAHMESLDSLLNVFSSFTAEELAPITAELPYLVRDAQPNPLRHYLLREVWKRVEEMGEKQTVDRPQSGATAPLGADSLPHLPNLIQPKDACRELIESADRIVAFNIIGDAAGTATLFGILCFLLSVVCLAKATQPPSVWIPSMAACSCIIILPGLNKLLGLYHFSAPICPSLAHNIITRSAGIPNVFDV
jgi:hypothetical protein